MYQLSDYDFSLPPAAIAQTPSPKRDHSRLLLLDRKKTEPAHHRFYELTDFFSAGDVLVLNNTRVVQGRLCGQKKTGGKAEVLLLDYAGRKSETHNGKAVVCACLVKTSKNPQIGSCIYFDHDLSGEIIGIEDGIFTIRFLCNSDFEDAVERIGHTPLPPYIKRDAQTLEVPDDRCTYQTIYATQKGAIAAPTAGLHFTPDVFKRLAAKGVSVVEITLHVGYGTFSPVRVDDIRNHRMHAERFSISEQAAATVNGAKANGGRIIAVGTTSVRTLEYAVGQNGRLTAGGGQCDLFIYPGYAFKMIDGMITNFHLPQSTLIMLVSAFAGRERVLAAYHAAIQKGYRFYSYGDAMLII